MSAPPQQRVVPLDLLIEQESGVVLEVVGAEATVHRLCEMGLSTGTTVRMVRPGSPCLIQVGEKKLSLRIEEEFEILVEMPH